MIKNNANNDNRNFKKILKLLYEIEVIKILPNTAPANPAIAKIKIKKTYSFKEKLKKYINKIIFIEC